MLLRLWKKAVPFNAPLDFYSNVIVELHVNELLLFLCNASISFYSLFPETRNFLRNVKKKLLSIN